MGKKAYILFLLFTIFIFNLKTSCHTENQPGLTLEETFNIYVKSVQNSDLKGLFSTVSKNPSFTFLTASGKIINTRKGYYDFHKEWFKEKDWQMPVDSVMIKEEMNYGYITAIFHYRQKISESQIYNLDSFFTLIFRREDNMWKVVADFCSPIKRFITEGNSRIKYDTDQVFLYDIIKKRRTVRKYKSTEIPREHILKILDAARFAPTAGNQQPWKFLIIQDRKKLNRLSEEALMWYMESVGKKQTPEGMEKIKKQLKNILKNVLSAPVYIAVLVDTKSKYPDYIIYDGTLATGNLMIAARALGYGTGFFTTFFPEKKMKIFFNIPHQYKLICFTPIGIPEKWPSTPPKKKLKDVIVFESF